MPIETRFVQTAGLTFHLREAGEGPPLVFLHGFPADSWMWRHQLEGLSNRWHCIAPDTRGYGLTEKPHVRVTRDLLARDVIDLLDALSLGAVTLIGHDWGGIIASATAFRRPERINRLVLLDAPCSVWPLKGKHGFWFKAEPRPERFFAQHARDFIGAVFGGDERSYGGPPETPWPPLSEAGHLSPLAGTSSPFLSIEDVAHYADVFDNPDVWFNAVQYYRDGAPFHKETTDPQAPGHYRYELFSSTSVAEMWNHPAGIEKHPDYGWFPVFAPEDRKVVYDRPTLLIYSRVMAPDAFDLDEGCLPRDNDLPRNNPFTASFAEHFPNLTTRAVGGGHFMPEEDPSRVNEYLAEFLTA
jgi:pimeloyl-ACP methyl ester carboxylesterase